MGAESLKSLKLMLKGPKCYWANIGDEHYLFTDSFRLYKTRIKNADKKLISAFVSKFLAIPEKDQCLELSGNTVKVNSYTFGRLQNILSMSDSRDIVVTDTGFLKITERRTIRFLKGADIFAVDESFFAPLGKYGTIWSDSRGLSFVGEDEESMYLLLPVNYGDVKEEIKKVFFLNKK